MKFSPRIVISTLDKLKTLTFLEKNALNSNSRALKMLSWSLLLIRSCFYEAKTAIFTIVLLSTAQYCANQPYIFWITAIITLKKVGFLVREVWGTQLRVKKLRAHFHVLCTAGPYEIVGSNPVKDKKNSIP